MFSALLDVAIGLILLYLILSIMASAINEILSNLFQWRAAFLLGFLERLLQDPRLVRSFFLETSLALHLNVEKLPTTNVHPTTIPGKVRAGISDWRERLILLREVPAYIKAEDFAQAIFDLMRDMRNDQTGLRSLQALSLDEWKGMLNSNNIPLPLKNVLTSAIDKAQEEANAATTDIERIRKYLEDWYDHSMDRVSGWYKRRIQIMLFLIGLTVSVGFNLDTISITNKLLQNPALREAIAAQAQVTAKQVVDTSPNLVLTPTTQPGATPSAATPQTIPQTTPQPSDVAKNINVVRSLQGELNQLNIPMGWPDPDMPDPNAGIQLSWWTRKLLGLLITTLAVFQGAPFWFDLLNKITNLRSAGKPPERAGETG